MSDDKEEMVEVASHGWRLPRKDVIVLKDGTVVPADDFWLYAPTWVALKYGEPANAIHNSGRRASDDT